MNTRVMLTQHRGKNAKAEMLLKESWKPLSILAGGRYLMEIYTKTETFMDCVNFVKDVSSSCVNFHGESNLIVGDLSKNLEDIALIKCSL